MGKKGTSAAEAGKHLGSRETTFSFRSSDSELTKALRANVGVQEQLQKDRPDAGSEERATKLTFRAVPCSFGGGILGCVDVGQQDA